MQKFTVFSIVLSLVVVLTLADLLFHGYLGKEQEETLPLEESAAEQSAGQQSAPNESVQLQEEVPLTSQVTLPSLLTTDLLVQAGFLEPTLKASAFSGLVFEFLPFSHSGDSTVYGWSLFEGSNYVGSITEIRFSTDTGGFQGYLNLRDAAQGLSDLGTTNEVNNYGDASFYFNHKVQTQTVRLAVRVGSTVYGFEYSPDFHEKMKNVFDSLRSLQ